MNMGNTKDVTVTMPEELVDEIEDQLEYGDSRSGWIREAVEERLERETQGNSNRMTPATAD